MRHQPIGDAGTRVLGQSDVMFQLFDGQAIFRVLLVLLLQLRKKARACGTSSLARVVVVVRARARSNLAEDGRDDGVETGGRAPGGLCFSPQLAVDVRPFVLLALAHRREAPLGGVAVLFVTGLAEHANASQANSPRVPVGF